MAQNIDNRIQFFMDEEESNAKEEEAPLRPEPQQSTAPEQPAPKETPKLRGRLVSVPRTDKGTPRTYSPRGVRENRARLLFAGLVLLAVVGLVSTCQNLTASAPSGFADAGHTHAPEPTLGETALREASLYMTRQWRDMLPFPSRISLLAAEPPPSELSDRTTERPAFPAPNVEAVFLKNSSVLPALTPPQEEHEILLITSNSEGEQNYWNVTLRLTAATTETDTISHTLDPRVVPSDVGATPSPCSAEPVQLGQLAGEVLEEWAVAWLASDVGALVRIAGATAEDTAYPGYPVRMGMLEIGKIYRPCGDGGTEDHVTIMLSAIDCQTGAIVQITQVVDLKFRSTPNPQIPAWSPVGELPTDRSFTLTERDERRGASISGARRCEAMEDYLSAPPPTVATTTENPLLTQRGTPQTAETPLAPSTTLS